MKDSELIKDLQTRGYVPKFPDVLDASALSDYKACPRKFFWSTLLKQVRKEANPHFVAGGAYAKGHEVFRKLYYNGTPKDEALAAGLIALIKEYGDYEPNPDGKPSEKFKTCGNVQKAFVSYYEEFPPESDYIVPVRNSAQEPLVEFSFGVPFLNFKNPQTQDPIIYGGRFDAIVHMVPGGWKGDYNKTVEGTPLYGYDDKTTYSLGPTWSSSWALRSQFLGYTWATAETTSLKLNGFIIRGCAIQAREIKHISTTNTYSAWMVAEWLETTYETVKQIISDWENESWKKDFDSACSHYGGCHYTSLCLSPVPGRWLKSEFKERDWSPIDVR